MSEQTTGWDGRPPQGTQNGSWHVIADPDGDTYRMRWEDGSWHPDPPWDGDWSSKEVEPHELAALGDWNYQGKSSDQTSTKVEKIGTETDDNGVKWDVLRITGKSA